METYTKHTARGNYKKPWTRPRQSPGNKTPITANTNIEKRINLATLQPNAKNLPKQINADKDIASELSPAKQEPRSRENLTTST